MSMNPDEKFLFHHLPNPFVRILGGKGVHQNLSLGFQGGKGVHQNLVDAEVQKTMCIRTDKICLPFIKHPLLKFKELSERRCGEFYFGADRIGHSVRHLHYAPVPKVSLKSATCTCKAYGISSAWRDLLAKSRDLKMTVNSQRDLNGAELNI